PLSALDRPLPPWTACSTKPAPVRSIFASQSWRTWSWRPSTTTLLCWGHYELHAFVVMPNHVHVLVTPTLALRKLTKSLKGITTKRANARMALTGSPFWQEESFDHLVRNQREFEKIRSYIEENPVRAGLVRTAAEYRWSSAGWPTRGSSADQGSAPL